MSASKAAGYGCDLKPTPSFNLGTPITALLMIYKRQGLSQSWPAARLGSAAPASTSRPPSWRSSGFGSGSGIDSGERASLPHFSDCIRL
jgi:hypothetical protein